MLSSSEKSNQISGVVTNDVLHLSVRGLITQLKSPALHRTAEAKAAKAETERLVEAAAAEREQLADLEASNSRLQKHVEVRDVAAQ